MLPRSSGSAGDHGAVAFYVADLGWPRIHAVNEPLAIDADTIACEWDGTPVDYGVIVGHLATADGLR